MEFKNPQEELERFRSRLAVAGGFVLVCFTLLFVRFVWLQIAPIFFAAHGVALAVRLIAGDMFPGWSLLLAPVFEALLWPVVVLLLLAPQRRAPDPDKNRPL